jgi:hypothetical protein
MSRRAIVSIMLSAISSLMACECQPHAAHSRTEMALHAVTTELEMSSIRGHCLVLGDHGVPDYLVLIDPAYPVERARLHRDAWGHEIWLSVRDGGPAGLHVQILAPGRDGEAFTLDDISEVVHLEARACQ